MCKRARYIALWLGLVFLVFVLRMLQAAALLQLRFSGNFHSPLVSAFQDGRFAMINACSNSFFFFEFFLWQLAVLKLLAL